MYLCIDCSTLLRKKISAKKIAPGRGCFREQAMKAAEKCGIQ